MAVTHHFALVASLFLVASAIHIPLRLGKRSEIEGHGRSLQATNVNQTSIESTDTDDLFYYGVVNFGTPPQPVSLWLDTTRAWTWVASAKCGNPCSTPRSFDPEASTTFEETTVYKELDHKRGIASGYVVSDAVSIGDDSDGYLTTPSMQFLLVDYIWGNVDYPFDGVFGLAFGTYLGGASTFLDTLLSNGVINRRIFSLYFGSTDFLGGTGTNSAFTVGEYDLEKYSDEDVIFLPVYKAVGLWSLQLVKVQMGDTTIEASSDIAVFDSTSFYVKMPDADYAAIMSVLNDAGSCALDSSGWFICDCGMAYSIDSYPDIVLTLGTRSKFALKSTDYFTVQPDGCYLLLDGGVSQWMLGTPFMRAYYTIFDMDNEVIGLAASLDNQNAGTLALAGLLMMLWGT